MSEVGEQNVTVWLIDWKTPEKYYLQWKEQAAGWTPNPRASSSR